MKKLLFFDVMITPKIITFIYWIALLVVLVGALVTGAEQGVKGILFGAPIMFVFCAVLLRVWCELLIVIFKVNENLQKVSDRS